MTGKSRSKDDALSLLHERPCVFRTKSADACGAGYINRIRGESQKQNARNRNKKLHLALNDGVQAMIEFVPSDILQMQLS